MTTTSSPSRTLYIPHEERARLTTACKALLQATDRFTDDRIDHVPLRDDEHDALSELIEHGYTIENHGASRIIVRFPPDSDVHDYIVKLSRYGTTRVSIGFAQNATELEVYSTHNEPGYPLLPPVDWEPANGRWLIMPHGTALTNDSLTDHQQSLIDDTITHLETHFPELDPLEFTPQNFVLYNNKAYFADYGAPTFTIE